MNKTQRNVLIGTAGGAAVIALWFSRTRPPGAAETFAEVRELTAQEHFDEQYVLRRLELTLQQAQDEGNFELAAEALIARGTLYFEIGAIDAARLDFERVLSELRPEDPTTRRLLARTEEAAGNFDLARAALQALLIDEPQFGDGWVEAGLLEQRLARARIEQCSREIDFALAGEPAQRARALVERIAASDPEDPARITAAFELRKIFPPDAPDRLSVVQVLADEASELLSAAREKYVRSFSHGLVPDAVSGYLAILVAAGELDAAIDFGTIALARPELAEHQASAEILISAMLERGDAPWAANMAEEWVKKDVPFDIQFLYVCAQALRRGRRWGDLQNCIGRIKAIGTSVDIDNTLLYKGLAWAGMGQVGPALNTLRKYLSSDLPEPYEGAYIDAWRQVAALSVKMKDSFGEREALQEIVRAEPDSSGGLWLRLAELQLSAKHSGFLLPLESWTRAMCALPRRADDLMPRFLELGQRALEAENKDATLTFNELKSSGRIMPRGKSTAYLLYALAKMHAEQANNYPVLIITQRLLEDYPGFLPALDLLIDAELAMAKQADAAEHYVQRFEGAGPDGRSRHLAVTFARHPFTDDQKVRLMEADPGGTGRLIVARYLLAHGERVAALRVLQGGADEEPSGQEILMTAGILSELGRFDDVLAVLGQLEPASDGARRALPLVVESALLAGDTALALKAADTAVKSKERDTNQQFQIGTTLLRLGQAGAASSVLRSLDSGRTRNGRVLISLGLAALGEGNYTEAQAYCDRAEAFVDSEVAGLARALVAAKRGDNFGLQREIRELSARGGFEAGLPAAAAALLLDDPERALKLAEEHGGASAGSAWNLIVAAAGAQQGLPYECPEEYGPAGTEQTRRFVRGSALEPRDPRLAALMLLAARVDALAPYVAGELRSADSSGVGLMWPRLLEASTLAQSKQLAPARLALEELVAAFPACELGWDELERIERERVKSPDHPALQSLRDRRLGALGSSRPESPEGLLLRARRALLEGRAEAAESLARRALERREHWAEARATLATSLTLLGRSDDSLTAWKRALTDAPAGRAGALVAGFLEALEFSERISGLSVAQVLPVLEDFAQVLPSDPRLALALADRELRRDDNNPSIGYARALSGLESFRLLHRGRGLEELQPGSTAAWARFMVQLDPEEGLAFLEAERLREPGNIELWILLGRVLLEGDDSAGALKLLQRAGIMSPDPDVYRELATARASSGSDARVVRATLERARQLDGKRKLDLDAELLIARTRMRQGQPGAGDRVVVDLEPFWEARRRLSRTHRTELALILAQALLLRDWPGDRSRVREIVAEWAPLESDPYSRTLAHAFDGLTPGEALNEPPEEEPEASEESVDEEAELEEVAGG